MEEGVTYADLRLPPTPGNGVLLPAPGTPALRWVPCPPAAPCPLKGCSPSPAPPCSLLSGIFFPNSLLSSPLADCLLSGFQGFQGGFQGQGMPTAPQCHSTHRHPSVRSAHPVPSAVCRETISRRVKGLANRVSLSFPGLPHCLLRPCPGFTDLSWLRGSPLLPPSPQGSR